jgi:alpha-amylase/alpha-mannosidase (GH57 family)
MVLLLEKYPGVFQTFNLVPSLIEQVEDYTSRSIRDKYLELSYKNSEELNSQEKAFIRDNFFSINTEKVIALFPRYYELYFKKARQGIFNAQDFLDLQLLFNLAWIDPYFRQKDPQLCRLVNKARFFTEDEKRTVLDKQTGILEEIIPAYKKFSQAGQIEITLSPYFHPILPLLYSTNTAREANLRAALPKVKFSYPEDARAQIEEAVKFFCARFGTRPCGMWPSEESVSEHILPFILQAGINWIVTDEAILFKSLKLKRRDTRLLYRPFALKREGGTLNIVFRDRNLSDLIGFVYHKYKAADAVNDFMRHLEDIAGTFKNEDTLVTVAMDGENAWEYYDRDGHDFLELLYQRLQEAKFLKTTTVNEYLKNHPPKDEIKRLAAGSWIFGDFGKWIGSAEKIKAWECLAKARQELKTEQPSAGNEQDLLWKQMYVLEGSDWFWWAGEDINNTFTGLFNKHLENFYTLLKKGLPRPSRT